MAAAIKLGKMWYVKQQESEIFLSKEKLQTRFDAEDSISRPQPAFLLRAMEKIEKWATEKPEAFPEIMQKIRELYSYVMSTNNRAKVPLDKELEMLRIYIELEGQGLHEDIKITMELPDCPTGKKITPLLILSMAENSFNQLSLLDAKSKTIDFKAAISESNFEMEISWSKPDDTSAMTRESGVFLAKINRYLNLIYPNGNNLKMIIRPCLLLMQLKINLDRSVN